MPLRLSTRQARLVVFGYNAITSKIEWMHSPYSPQYAGSPLSLAGGQVFAFYKDGTVSDITDVCGFNPTEGSTLQYPGSKISMRDILTTVAISSPRIQRSP